MFNWNPEYSIKIASIDMQHQNLLAMGSKLFEAMSSGTGQAVAGQILERLIQYTATHFAYEERLMQEHSYPGLAAHKAEHEALVAKVNQFQAEFKSGRASISIQLLNFLKDWLVGHIQGSDRKYAPYVLGKAA